MTPRGSGRTTRQMLSAPLGALYVWCNDRLEYPRDRARDLGRRDLEIAPPRIFEHSDRILGGRYPTIILDHACQLTGRQEALYRDLVGHLSRGFEDEQFERYVTRVQSDMLARIADWHSSEGRRSIRETHLVSEELRRCHYRDRAPPDYFLTASDGRGREHRVPIGPVGPHDRRFYGVDVGREPAHTSVMSYSRANLVAEVFDRGDDMTATAVREHYRELIDNEIYRTMFFGAGGSDDVGDAQAQARAEALLRQWLSPQQLAQYEHNRSFDVIGCHTGTRYRIRNGRQMNIDELDAEGRKVCGWCFLPEGQLVAGDVMLAQKIALETNERAALKVANRYPLHGELTSPAPFRFASELRTTLPQGTWRRLYEGNPVREPVDSARWTG